MPHCWTIMDNSLVHVHVAQGIGLLAAHVLYTIERSSDTRTIKFWEGWEWHDDFQHSIVHISGPVWISRLGEVAWYFLDTKPLIFIASETDIFVCR